MDYRTLRPSGLTLSGLYAVTVPKSRRLGRVINLLHCEKMGVCVEIYIDALRSSLALATTMYRILRVRRGPWGPHIQERRRCGTGQPVA